MFMKRKKHGLKLICIALSLALVILGTFIIGQNTGQKAVLAEAFVDKVSDQVTDQMDDDVTGQIAEKVLSEKIGDYVSTAMVERAVSENIKDSLPEVTKKGTYQAGYPKREADCGKGCCSRRILQYGLTFRRTAF